MNVSADDGQWSSDQKKKRKEKKEDPKKVEKGWRVAHGPMKTGDG